RRCRSARARTTRAGARLRDRAHLLPIAGRPTWRCWRIDIRVARSSAIPALRATRGRHARDRRRRRLAALVARRRARRLVLGSGSFPTVSGGAPGNLEVTFDAEVLRVTFEREDSTFRVVKVSIAGRAEPVTLIGHFPRVAAGAHVRVRGVPEMDKKHGEQVRALAVT